ncbi:agamous-like MADS-box protein AGL29 [Coffea arabica]|uniref:Agamous-like MADS-box protein AGL29 n=1 Tax=Coffea arabica TaxID=13443 RepID=A0A6P6SF98_COFAR|nr:agamous-like MADS-box protein AGL62 [Coffea arabica]
MVPVKKTRGRQKIDIAKIQNEQHLQVTFSKRRAGLFKKASELCTLTGSEVALVVFSPGEKVYSFGSPNIDAIIEKFEFSTPKSDDASTLLLEAHHRFNVQHLNKQLSILENQLEAKKKIGETLNQLRQVGQIRHWWYAPINDLNLEQLESLHSALCELQNTVRIELEKPIYENTNQVPDLNGINPSGISPLGINTRENEGGAFDLIQSQPPRTKAFAPTAASSRVNTGISSNAWTRALTAENGPTASLSFAPNASEFDGATMPCYPSQGFNTIYGGLTLFKI